MVVVVEPLLHVPLPPSKGLVDEEELVVVVVVVEHLLHVPLPPSKGLVDEEKFSPFAGSP